MLYLSPVVLQLSLPSKNVVSSMGTGPEKLHQSKFVLQPSAA